MMQKHMKAQLVYDGIDIKIPESMGTPKANQMQGTPLEQLGELACRVCYDSLGVGRPSSELHKHILDVDNTSVYEHCVFTVRFYISDKQSKFLRNFINRKGIWIDVKPYYIDITVNFRAVLEWDKWSSETNKGFLNDFVEKTLWSYAHDLAPQIFRLLANPIFTNYTTELVTENLNEDQAHISMWLYGSRGFTHEQVRHRFAMSQRSTRYVDENESEYIEHPLITAFLTDKTANNEDKEFMRNYIDAAIAADRRAYVDITKSLEAYKLEHGLSKTDARKQARGAARGNLGNALASEMIFTASVSGWKWMLQKRASKFADAEIRAVYTDVLPELKRSQYGFMFEDYNLIPSPDGIGMVLNEFQS